jgi:3-hydroxyisobutyrate dehydrogenase-like beta-hydroxyacid dehydrogenase
MKTPQKLGFVGLGKMGYPMAGRLAGAGFALTVFDINRSAQERFVAENGARSAEGLSEVARNSDLIMRRLMRGICGEPVHQILRPFIRPLLERRAKLAEGSFK